MEFFIITLAFIMSLIGIGLFVLIEITSTPDLIKNKEVRRGN